MTQSTEIKLTEPQAVILCEALNREGFKLYPLPASIKAKGAALQKTLNALLNKGLVAETPAMLDDTIWREDEQGRLTLIATNLAEEALGMNQDPETAGQCKPVIKDQTLSPRQDTKQQQLINLLEQPDGITIDEMAIALNWQRHTVHGAIAGVLRKKLGLIVTSHKTEDRGRVYQIR